MTLTVVTPHESATYAIVWLELNTPTGNIVVQPGHAPTILILSPGQQAVFRLDTGKQESLAVRQGIASIGRDHATLVINETV